MDIKKTEMEILILKIKTQQEIIAAQTRVSAIDIDLQLDYIRALYEHYIALKQGLALKETAEEKFELSDCGTLPLFNNNTAERKIQNTESVEKNSTEGNIQKTEYEEILTDFEDFGKNDAEFFGDSDREEENLTEYKTQNAEREDDFDKIEDEEDENKLEEKEEEEEEEDDDDDDWGFDELKDDDDAIESPTALPTMEIEMNLPANSGIDIDAIEFDIEEDEDTDNENVIGVTDKIPIPHIGTSEQPRYWGDELDIDPVPQKPTSIGDKYANTKPSLNEIVSGFKPDESIGMKLQHGSVSDLMKSIDMNLKFLFVKNLFKGNGSVFTEEINKINSINKLHEAIKYVEEIKDRYNWDDKSEAYTELYKLVLRKYAR